MRQVIVMPLRGENTPIQALRSFPGGSLPSTGSALGDFGYDIDDGLDYDPVYLRLYAESKVWNASLQ